MKQGIKQPPFGYFIGKATDEPLRTNATSGGIGSAITLYLLSTDKYDTALTFRFDVEKCMYVPVFVHRQEDINVCGSIYQDINIPQFLKSHIDEIGKGIIISAPPCQISLIRHILKTKDINSFVISFCCSGQTTIDGTWKYYQLLGIDKKDVRYMQYRGKGWPSGIQITLKNGQIVKKDNWTFPWTVLHQSLLYAPDRCLLCKLDTSYSSDISVADPWLDKYKKSDMIGHTMYIVNTMKGMSVINEMETKGLIENTPSNADEYAIAQRGNIDKTYKVSKYKCVYLFINKIRKNKLYFKYCTSSVIIIIIHNKMIDFLKKIVDLSKKTKRMLGGKT